MQAISNLVNTSSDNSSASPPGTYGLSSGKIAASVVYLMIVAAGIFGNTLVIVTVLIDRRMRASVTNLYILNLAAADLMSLLLALSQIVLHLLSEDWLLGIVLCKAQRFTMTTALYASVITLTAVCVERYVAIVHPMRAHLLFSRTRALLTILGCWALGLLLAAQSLAFLTVMPLPPSGHRRCFAKYGANPAEQARAIKWVGAAEICLFYFLPLGLQIVLYTRMSFALSASGGGGGDVRRDGGGSFRGDRLPRKSNNASSNAGRKQVVKMLIACVIVYFVCYLSKLLEVAFNIFDFHPIRRDNAQVIIMAMVYANSAVNPLLYTVFSSNFRHQFRLTFQRCACKDGGSRGMADGRRRLESLAYRPGMRNLSRCGGRGGGGGGVGGVGGEKETVVIPMLPVRR